MSDKRRIKIQRTTHANTVNPESFKLGYQQGFREAESEVLIKAEQYIAEELERFNKELNKQIDTLNKQAEIVQQRVKEAEAAANTYKERMEVEIAIARALRRDIKVRDKLLTALMQGKKIQPSSLPVFTGIDFAATSSSTLVLAKKRLVNQIENKPAYSWQHMRQMLMSEHLMLDIYGNRTGVFNNEQGVQDEVYVNVRDFDGGEMERTLIGIMERGSFRVGGVNGTANKSKACIERVNPDRTASIDITNKARQAEGAVGRSIRDLQNFARRKR